MGWFLALWRHLCFLPADFLFFFDFSGASASLSPSLADRARLRGLFPALPVVPRSSPGRARRRHIVHRGIDVRGDRSRRRIGRLAHIARQFVDRRPRPRSRTAAQPGRRPPNRSYKGSRHTLQHPSSEREIDADSMNYTISRVSGYYGWSKVERCRPRPRKGRVSHPCRRTLR